MSKTIFERNGTNSKRNLYIKGILVLALMIASAVTVLALLNISHASQTASNQPSFTPVKIPVQANPMAPVALSNAKSGVVTAGFDSVTSVIPTEQISVMVGLNYQHQDQLNKFLNDVQNPNSPLYHKFISRDDFINTYSPDYTTYSAMVTYFTQNGFQVQTYPDRVSISLVGSFSQFDHVFNTQIQTLHAGKTSYFAPTSSVSMPAQFASYVSTISGLNNKWHAQLRPMFTGSGSSELLYGTDVQAAYQLKQLYSVGYPTNLTVATILWSGSTSSGTPVGPYYPSDITHYFSTVIPAGEPQPQIFADPIGGAPQPGLSSTTDSSQANYESTLDLEMVGSAAPGISVVEVYGPQATTSYLDQCFAEVLNPSASAPAALQHTVAISNSWGGSDSADSLWTSYEQQAAARGITVLASSGDTGTTTSPSFPATSAYNTYGTIAVGGTATVLSGTTSTDGTGTTGITSQAVWYNTPSSGDGSQSGVSSIYAEPSWQSGSADANGVITAVRNGRGTADIAAVAANMEIYITPSGGSGSMTTLWGTSVACPVVAGVVAVMDYYMNSKEGFFAPTIYQLGQAQYTGSYSTAKPFFDITTGSTGAYPTKTGYDLPTGWGSINAYNFILAQQGVTQTYTVTFTESGLTSGTSWSVTLGGSTLSSTTSTISFTEAPGTYSYSVGSVTGYTVSPSSGSLTVTSANVNQAITFTAATTYTVSFTESGLPSGTSWSVTLAGSTQSSTTSTISFSEVAGTYSYTVNAVSGYTVSPASGSVTVSTANVNTAVTFTAIPTYSVSFTESGLPSGTSWSITLAGSTLSSTTSSITFSKVAGTYSYSVGAVAGYSASPSSGSVTVTSSNVNTAITFSVVTQANGIWAQVSATSISTYSLNEAEQFNVGTTTEQANFVTVYLAGSGSVTVSIGTALWGSDVLAPQTVNIVSGTSYYNVTFSAVTLAASTNYYLNVMSASGSPTWGYTTSATVNKGATQDYWYSGSTLQNDNTYPNIFAVGYQATVQSYTVSFTESGLTSGTSWSVTLAGSTLSSTTNTISFSKPNGAYSYTIGAVSGYTVSPSSGSVTVNGANVNTAITYTAIPTYTVSFTESGLTSGTSWSVTLAGSTLSSTTNTISFTEPAGTYSYTIGAVSGYTVSPSSGSVTVTSSNVNTAITYTAVPTYSVSFTESGLPASTSWSVTLAGSTLSSTTNTITFTEVAGTYSYTIGAVSQYTASPSSGSVTVTSANVNTAITFTQNTYTLSFTESGLPASTSWSVTAGGSTLSSTTSTISFTEVAGTYSYTVGTVTGYTASPASGSVTLTSSSQNVAVTFTSTSTPSVTFYSYVSANTIYTYSLPEAEQFNVGSSAHKVNQISLYLSGSGVASVSLGSALWGVDVLAAQNINVVSGTNNYTITFASVNLAASTNYYISVKQVSGSVTWGYATTTTHKVGATRDYWYSGSTLYNDNSYPNIYSVGYNTNGPAVITQVTTSISQSTTTVQAVVSNTINSFKAITKY